MVRGWERVWEGIIVSLYCGDVVSGEEVVWMEVRSVESWWARWERPEEGWPVRIISWREDVSERSE